jgi:hypothetical protein
MSFVKALEIESDRKMKDPVKQERDVSGGRSVLTELELRNGYVRRKKLKDERIYIALGGRLMNRYGKWNGERSEDCER